VNGPRKTPDDAPILAFSDQKAWANWLDKNHDRSSGVWVRLAKKATGVASVTYPEALEEALCYGWIDGRKKSGGETAWLQKFTPRAARSVWSKINSQKALALIESGRMKPAGLREIERAKSDGRWDKAYDSPRAATVSPDFQAALNNNPKASAFFATLSGRNRYALLYRIQVAKRPETRAKRINQFITMLENHEKLYPRSSQARAAVASPRESSAYSTRENLETT
jgi:uncharacterized protein YdeI (YjbR/CyaY-like superfamily)